MQLSRSLTAGDAQGVLDSLTHDESYQCDTLVKTLEKKDFIQKGGLSYDRKNI